MFVNIFCIQGTYLCLKKRKNEVKVRRKTQGKKTNNAEIKPFIFVKNDSNEFMNAVPYIYSKHFLVLILVPHNK